MAGDPPNNRAGDNSVRLREREAAEALRRKREREALADEIARRLRPILEEKR